MPEQSNGRRGGATWQAQARILRVVAHPVRLVVLAALTRRSQCVKDLNKLVPLSQARMSQHMAALRRVGLVACHVNGPLRCYYVLRPTLVRQLMKLLAAEHPERPRDRAAVLREIAHATQAPQESDT